MPLLFPSLTRRDALRLAALGAAAILPGGGILSRLAAVEADALPDLKARMKGLTLGVAGYTFRDLSVEASIAAMKALDLTTISLFKAHVPWDRTAEECRVAANRFRDAGLTLFGSGVINLPNDEKALRSTFENVKAAGLQVMTCKPETDAFPLIERFVKEFDQRLAIHNHGPEDKLYPSPYDAWKLIQPLDARIGLCVDVGHCYRAGVNPAEALKTCASRVYDVHLKDSVAIPGGKDVPVQVGRGVLDIRSILTALIEIHYTGAVSFEYERRAVDPVTGLAESVGYVRGMLAAMS